MTHKFKHVGAVDLRLGDCIVTSQGDNQYRAAWVMLLGDYNAPHRAISGQIEDLRAIGTTQSIETVMDHILNHEDVPPSAAAQAFTARDEADVSAAPAMGAARGAKKLGDYMISPDHRLDNFLPSFAVTVADYDPATLLEATQLLHPGVKVELQGENGAVADKISAVGFGLGGPIGIAFASNPQRWLNAADLYMHINTPGRPQATTLYNLQASYTRLHA